MPVVRHGIGLRRLRRIMVSGVCVVISVVHPRHRPRHRDPVEDQRQNERKVEQKAGHDRNRLRAWGESFNSSATWPAAAFSRSKALRSGGREPARRQRRCGIPFRM